MTERREDCEPTCGWFMGGMAKGRAIKACDWDNDRNSDCDWGCDLSKSDDAALELNENVFGESIALYILSSKVPGGCFIAMLFRVVSKDAK